MLYNIIGVTNKMVYVSCLCDYKRIVIDPNLHNMLCCMNINKMRIIDLYEKVKKFDWLIFRHFWLRDMKNSIGCDQYNSRLYI